LNGTLGGKHEAPRAVYLHGDGHRSGLVEHLASDRRR
jgi:hypothetical protein